LAFEGDQSLLCLGDLVVDLFDTWCRGCGVFVEVEEIVAVGSVFSHKSVSDRKVDSDDTGRREKCETAPRVSARTSCAAGGSALIK
jgi:hypothetical protein